MTTIVGSHVIPQIQILNGASIVKDREKSNKEPSSILLVSVSYLTSVSPSPSDVAWAVASYKVRGFQTTRICRREKKWKRDLGGSERKSKSARKESKNYQDPT